MSTAHFVIDNNNNSKQLSGVSNRPARADSAAPPPIMIAPPRPEAVPARCGRTESKPADAMGITRPNPRQRSRLIRNRNPNLSPSQWPGSNRRAQRPRQAHQNLTSLPSRKAAKQKPRRTQTRPNQMHRNPTFLHQTRQA